MVDQSYRISSTDKPRAVARSNSQGQIFGLFFYLLSIFCLPFVSWMVGPQDRPELSSPVEITVPEASEMNGGYEHSPAPSGSYFETDLPVGPFDVEMEKIHRILNDFRTGLSGPEKQKLAHVIYEESLHYQYDPKLVLAVIVTESSLYNWSQSPMGAIGLMQIMPATGSFLAEATNISWDGMATLFDPFVNIKLGIKYLALMLHQFKDLEVALTAYNYGPTRVQEMLERCDRLPKVYSQKVLSTYKKFRKLESADSIVS